MHVLACLHGAGACCRCLACYAWCVGVKGSMQMGERGRKSLELPSCDVGAGMLL